MCYHNYYSNNNNYCCYYFVFPLFFGEAVCRGDTNITFYCTKGNECDGEKQSISRLYVHYSDNSTDSMLTQS